MEIIPSATIMVGCWLSVTGLTKALIYFTNDRDVRNNFDCEKNKK